MAVAMERLASTPTGKNQACFSSGDNQPATKGDASCSFQGHCLQPGDASGAADAAVGTVLIVIHKERGQRV